MTQCLCGHAAHAGECAGLYLTRAGYVDCPCTGSRTGDRTPIAPAIRASLRETLETEHMPDWTQDAACRSAGIGGRGANRPGHLWKEAYADELSDGNIEEKLPEATAKAFQRDACAVCPVRRECLTYAFDTVDRHHVSLEWLSEEEQPEPVWVFTETEAGRRFGIFGGVPGRKREELALLPDRVARGLAWFETLATDEHWAMCGLDEGVADVL